MIHFGTMREKRKSNVQNNAIEMFEITHPVLYWSFLRNLSRDFAQIRESGWRVWTAFSSMSIPVGYTRSQHWKMVDRCATSSSGSVIPMKLYYYVVWCAYVYDTETTKNSFLIRFIGYYQYYAHGWTFTEYSTDIVYGSTLLSKSLELICCSWNIVLYASVGMRG